MKKTSDHFFCNTCKHHIPLREEPEKIICPLTLGLHDRNQIASCGLAEPREYLEFENNNETYRDN